MTIESKAQQYKKNKDKNINIAISNLDTECGVLKKLWVFEKMKWPGVNWCFCDGSTNMPRMTRIPSSSISEEVQFIVLK